MWHFGFCVEAEVKTSLQQPKDEFDTVIDALYGKMGKMSNNKQHKA